MAEKPNKPNYPGEITPLPEEIKAVVNIAHRLKGRAFLVGGPVRDLLLGRTSPDWDLAVDLRPGRVATKLQSLLKKSVQRLGGRFVFHPRFLTGTIELLNGKKIDIGHTRQEKYRQPGILPEVKPASIEHDLYRRDFTINAIALELMPNQTQKLIDPTNGQRDLQLHLIRIIYPESFIDDPTRIFRCIRFAIRLGYEIESGTLYLMRTAIKKKYPALLTPERLLYELRCIVREASVLKILEAIVKERVFESTWNWHPPREFLPDLKKVAQAHLSSEELYIALLSWLPVTTSWPLTRAERKAREALINFPELQIRLKETKTPSKIYQILNRIPTPALKILCARKRGILQKKIRWYLNELSNIQPQVRPRDLTALGVKPGPLIGKVLKQLLNAKLDGKVKTYSEELSLAKRLLARYNKDKKARR